MKARIDTISAPAEVGTCGRARERDRTRAAIIRHHRVVDAIAGKGESEIEKERERGRELL